ncbi:MAG: hypothetical protein ACI9WU_000232 [Myxococcota bacterium]|jgi:hypothetical protein
MVFNWVLASALTMSIGFSTVGCAKGAAKKEAGGGEPAKAPAGSAVKAKPVPAKAAAAPGGKATKPKPATQLQVIKFLDVTAHVPVGWTVEKPSSPMRLAQLGLPRVGDDKRDGVLTVIAAGGSVEANVARWAGQFEGEVKPVTKPTQIVGSAGVMVEISGTFLHKVRPMMPGKGTPLPDTLLLGAIFNTGRAQVFVKAHGPRATMDRWRGEFDGFLQAMKSENSGGGDGSGE